MIALKAVGSGGRGRWGGEAAGGGGGGREAASLGSPMIMIRKLFQAVHSSHLMVVQWTMWSQSLCTSGEFGVGEDEKKWGGRGEEGEGGGKRPVQLTAGHPLASSSSVTSYFSSSSLIVNPPSAPRPRPPSRPG
uniref:Uncharacterized protein n=1 Tax=Knipowitschia caucasica TaxID=637954 RepID=A0AAV2KV53_KNICA